jgi:hypothetical protein
MGDRMRGILNTIVQSTIARALILAIIGLPIAFYLGFTPAERSAIGLSAAAYLGFYSPAVGLAAIIGWLTWSWRWFGIVLAICVVLTAVIQLRSAGFLEWISLGQGVIVAVVFFIVCLCVMLAPYCKKQT